MSIFDRMDRLTSAAVDRVFSDVFTLTPMAARPNGPAALDPNRSVLTAKGVLTDAPAENAGIQLGTKRTHGGRNNDLGILQAGRRLELSVDVSAFGDEPPRQGDWIEVKGRHFTVSTTARDGLSRIVVKLSERT